MAYCWLCSGAPTDCARQITTITRPCFAPFGRVKAQHHNVIFLTVKAQRLPVSVGIRDGFLHFRFARLQKRTAAPC